MRRDHLEHIIRAAADVTNEQHFIIIGSQAILGQYPDAPDPLLISLEVDIYPLARPELPDAIDGSLGPGCTLTTPSGTTLMAWAPTPPPSPKAGRTASRRSATRTPMAQPDGASTSTTLRSRNTRQDAKKEPALYPRGRPPGSEYSRPSVEEHKARPPPPTTHRRQHPPPAELARPRTQTPSPRAKQPQRGQGRRASRGRDWSARRLHPRFLRRHPRNCLRKPERLSGSGRSSCAATATPRATPTRFPIS